VDWHIFMCCCPQDVQQHPMLWHRLHTLNHCTSAWAHWPTCTGTVAYLLSVVCWRLGCWRHGAQECVAGCCRS
jgi:hypothetical protein